MRTTTGIFIENYSIDDDDDDDDDNDDDDDDNDDDDDDGVSASCSVTTGEQIRTGSYCDPRKTPAEHIDESFIVGKDEQ